MPSSRARLIILALLLALVALAADVSTAVRRADITLTDSSGAARTNIALPFPLSTQTLLDNSFVTADTLDAQVHDSASTDVVFMPSPVDTAWEACVLFNQGTGSYTDDTTDCNDSDASDTAFPMDEVNDAFYFGAHWQFRILRITVGTAGVGTYTLTWEYCSDNLTGGATTACDTWTALPNISASSTNLTATGAQSVLFSIPDDFAESDESAGAGVTQSYYVRARVSAHTTSTTDPSFTQAWYDMGMWWEFKASLGANQQITDTVFTGFSAERTFHHYIPGSTGLTVSSPTFTPSSSTTNSVEIKGYFDTTATGSDRDILLGDTTDTVWSWDGAVSGQLDITWDELGSANDCVLQATGIADGQRTLKVEIPEDGLGASQTCTLYIDGVSTDTDATAGTGGYAPILTSFQIAGDDSTQGLEFFKATESSGLMLHYEINDDFTALVIPDRAAPGADPDAVPTFPSIPASFTSTLGSFETASAVSLVAGAAGSGQAISNVTGSEEGTSFAGNQAISTDTPFYSILNPIASRDYDSGTAGVQGIPIRFFYLFLLAGIFIIVVGITLVLTKQIFIVAIVGGLVLALFVRPMNVIEPWVLMFYAVIAALVVWIKDKTGVGV